MNAKAIMTTPRIIAPKKLIEVALPLDDINKACAREKSIRHGHPSTLHLWWARRPLAAARAVLFAQLVNDPSWKYTDEELKKPAIKGSITKKRNELFKLVSELVQWENTTNENVLERARAEIRSSWRETCERNKDHPDANTLFDPNKLPVFHDPFAGGGTIPLEAQRLGLVAHATDLNPVAVLINKAMIEIPPKFIGRAPVGPEPKSNKQTKATATEEWLGAAGLAEDVRRYGLWMRDEAETRIGSLYPKVRITKEMVKQRPDLSQFEGQDLTVIAWLWAHTVDSPNPAFAGVRVPLASTFVLSTKSGKESWVEPIIKGKTYRFSVKVGKPTKAAGEGTSAGKRAAFKCLMSGVPLTYDYIRAEGQAGRMGSRLMALVLEGVRSRAYIAPTPEMEAVALMASPPWRPTTPLPDNTRNFNTPLYGIKTFGDLFTDRQVTALTTFSDLVGEARERVLRDARSANLPSDERSLEAGGTGAVAYADAIAVYLTFVLSKVADGGSILCRWMSQRDSLFNTFAKQAFPMVWDFAEINVLADCTRSWTESLKWTAESVEGTPPVWSSRLMTGVASQADAVSSSRVIPASSTLVVSTDPPYYDNIGYAELSEFFYVWIRRTLKKVFPDLLATIAVPKAEELVATPYRHGGKEQAEAFFLEGMTKAIGRLADTNASAPITIYYAFKQSETASDGTGSAGWETFLAAVLRAGLAVVGTWPVRTEREGRAIGIGTNSLASSIVLVCRVRVVDAANVSRKDFARELDRVLPSAIADMIADPIASIAPVDLAQACIGPGMAIFSKHKAVLEADGTAMTVHNALVHINKAIDDYFAHVEGDLDADTRFCIGWFEQFGFETGAFGVADVLARAKGTSVDGVKEAGVIETGKGKVRLYELREYSKGWDPVGDDRIPVWEACHHMCRALGESEGDAGALLAQMPEKQEAIRLLAYRLYTLCDRKNWAEQARPYNELITSWPAIVEASHGVGHVGTQMDLV
ncbi:MAG: DUF1156 domain-containing protein [Archangium sp.]|nr:DUF1156 domain-containing protein [Archangium sp.]MDP3575352.1 DUF1156 domain-containing protein [Archangium sp.]